MQTTTTQNKIEEDIKKPQKRPSKFDNLLLDMVYNIVAWLPVTIISWVVSNLDF